MKFFLSCLATILLFFAFFLSCSENDLMLYHPKTEPEHGPNPPKVVYLLDTIDYPLNKFGLADRGDLVFGYNENDGMISIETINGDFYKIDTLDNIVAYSKLRENSTSISYDTLLIRLDNAGKAVSARHVTYNKNISSGVSDRSQNDSVHFTYNSSGYLVKMESFSVAGSKTSRYAEEYTIENGNIKGIEAMNSRSAVIASYTYTYDDTEYNPVSKYGYEMPYNTHSLKTASCILVTNLVYISDLLGKKNKNNVSGLVIHKDKEEYANIFYNYTIDKETGLLIQSKISGTVNGKELPDDYVTAFSYMKKVVKSE